MRFHLVITELEVGGAEKCLTDVACYLQTRGHEVRVISLGAEPATERGGLIDRLSSQKIEVDFLNAARMTDWFGLKRRLRKIATENRPDAAMSFLFHGNLASAAVYPRLGIPWIAGVRVADRSRWRAMLSRWIYRKAVRVACVSHTVANHVRNFEGCSPEKPTVITNGIDLTQIPNGVDTSINLGLSKPYVLFIGRYAAQKQIPWLVEILRQPFFQESNLCIATIGSGPLKSMIGDAARAHAGKIVDLGWQADVFPYLHGCEMLLLPSAYEGMPNVVLEAMACGKAVAATRVEGVVELLGENAAAQTADAGDLTAWIERVKSLCAKPELRVCLGAANRIRVQQEFELSSKMAMYEQLLVNNARS